MPVSPKRASYKQKDGSWKIVVTPPAWTGLPQNEIVLTEEQHNRYMKWATGRTTLIQHALPDLSPAQREVIMTGIDQKTWDRIMKDDV